MLEVKMKLELKEYKSVYRYKEINDEKTPILFNYLYVKKYAFKGNPPDIIKLSVSKGY